MNQKKSLLIVHALAPYQSQFLHLLRNDNRFELLVTGPKHIANNIDQEIKFVCIDEIHIYLKNI